MIEEEKDRIRRAEEIQRYTENRCQALEKENEQLRRENKDLQTRNHIVPEHYLSEAIDKCNELEAQIKSIRMEKGVLVAKLKI